MHRVNKIVFVVMLVFASCRSHAQREGITNCCLDTNDSYSRKSVLGSFASVLKVLAPDYQGVDKKGFYVSKDCKLIGAFIYDLSDTLNKETSLSECVKFKEGHVYHFAPIRQNVSYSSIAVLIDGSVKIFRAINCPKKGDHLDEVINYIGKSEIKNKEELIARLRNYRKYGTYIKVDEQSEFVCK